MYINVFLSWIAFCISLKALPARVILSVNTLMSICLQVFVNFDCSKLLFKQLFSLGILLALFHQCLMLR